MQQNTFLVRKMGMKKTIIWTVCMGMLFGSAFLSAESAKAETSQKSTADFSITEKDPNNPTDPDNGTLTLKQVPDFNFGVIEASQVYAGFSNKTAQAEGSLIVSDTRVGRTNWTLTAAMGKFSNSSSTLNGAALALTGTGSLGEDLAGTVRDDNQDANLVDGNGSHGKDEFIIAANQAKLTLGANPTAILENNMAFEATIEWNLISDSPQLTSA
jgi:hypothetical protein